MQQQMHLSHLMVQVSVKEYGDIGHLAFRTAFVSLKWKIVTINDPFVDIKNIV